MTTKNSDYRRLTAAETVQLERQGCLCNDWSLLLVADDFAVGQVWQTVFSGAVKLGRNVSLRCAEIATSRSDEGSMRAELLSEDGSLWIALSERLSYDTWEAALCTPLSEPSVTTLCDDVTVSSGVILRDTIVCERAVVSDRAIVERCFVGQGTHISKGFTANDCLFFSNCELEKGEACASVCGPHTVSHHKSTLIIGCHLSFANLGSGTNMSNHRYKLGPVHHGTLGRGCKTASGAHLVMPVEIGDFTMVMGKVSNVNTLSLPYSYLFGEGGKAYLVPAVNAFTVGTYRDLKKWAKRDRRPLDTPLDTIDYDIWTPDHLSSIATRALDHLRRGATAYDPTTEEYRFPSYVIRRKDYDRAILLYTTLLALSRDDAEAKERYRQAILADLRKELDIAPQLLPQVERLEAAIDRDFETN